MSSPDERIISYALVALVVIAAVMGLIGWGLYALFT